MTLLVIPVTSFPVIAFPMMPFLMSFPGDAISRHVISGDVISYYVISCDVISCNTISCDVISGDVIPFPSPVTSFPAIPFLADPPPLPADHRRPPLPFPRGSTADSPLPRTPLGAQELEPASYTYYYLYLLMFPCTYFIINCLLVWSDVMFLISSCPFFKICMFCCTNRFLTTSSSSSTGRATRRILHNLASKSIATRHRAFS